MSRLHLQLSHNLDGTRKLDPADGGRALHQAGASSMPSRASGYQKVRFELEEQVACTSRNLAHDMRNGAKRFFVC
nr:hypothetical protein CFP56_39020 [Quercus suber]